MSFHSILFDVSDKGNRGKAIEAPAFFRDLNLDQIVDAVTAGRQEYDLKPFFYARLTDPEAIAYRHEVMRDLETVGLLKSIRSFADGMRSAREYRAAAENLTYPHQKERWFLDAVGAYGEAVLALRRALGQSDLRSRGLLGFREHVEAYVASEPFEALMRDVQRLKIQLAAIRYCMVIDGDSVTVRAYNAEVDYSTVVEETFAKFKQGAAKDYRARFPGESSMNHVEALVLEQVARLYPQVFGALVDFCARIGDFLDPTMVAFDREIQFYVAYLEYAAAFRRVGLKFCYPQISAGSKGVSSRESFDLALAGKFVRENRRVVCNDFSLNAPERILVVTGPNQGGKTTFARAFGQLHYLASLGCPVPGAEARLLLFDRLFTHFEREEDLTTLRGKLQDDLMRIHRILSEATPNSIVVINEIFSSTSLRDAVYLGREVLGRIAQLDLLCVCVTFLDELSNLNEKTVSMVAEVVRENPTLRTFRIERRAADGLAYAVAIAEMYRLTRPQLSQRLNP